ncbi:unnamed protein product [Parnassius apollo]|uniref:(apollo) hypothetical protein n=1 Tax=Parnassius apollo TaxID=110799 RepID=A0A8S3X7E0_PARAO|nr:unnamed protein product [Parnassius apollo]
MVAKPSLLRPRWPGRKCYRRFNQDKKSAWRCAQCKNTKNELSINEVIFKEIRYIKSRVNYTPELLEDVKTIKCKLEELKDACNVNNKRLDEFDARIATTEENVSEIIISRTISP